MIISPFRKYLNESSQDNWEIVDGRDNKDEKNEKNEEKPKRITHSEIIKHKSFKQNKNKDQYKEIQNKNKPKHMLPYNNNVDQDEMDHIEKTNPALYAALTSWN